MQRTAPPRPNSTGPSNADRLAKIRPDILACTKCPHLVRSRTQVVFGVGNPDAELMFAGEAPGEDEDRQGEPFVGRAGELLTKIIGAMGFARSDVYIANVLKCRPDMPPGEPGNRQPRSDEMQTCLPYLRRQIKSSTTRPRGARRDAMQGLTGDTSAMARLWRRHEFDGIPLWPSPSGVSAPQSVAKRETQSLGGHAPRAEKLGKPISQKQRNFSCRGTEPRALEIDSEAKTQKPA